MWLFIKQQQQRHSSDNSNSPTSNQSPMVTRPSQLQNSHFPSLGAYQRDLSPKPSPHLEQTFMSSMFAQSRAQRSLPVTRGRGMPSEDKKQCMCTCVYVHTCLCVCVCVCVYHMDRRVWFEEANCMALNIILFWKGMRELFLTKSGY